jgi:hypothetical protein
MLAALPHARAISSSKCKDRLLVIALQRSGASRAPYREPTMPCHSGSTPSSARIELRPPEKKVLPIDARARLVTRTTFAILVVLLAFWVARDLLSALAWAAVIAITTWPIYIRFTSLISDGRSPVLVPMLFTLLTGLVLLVPIYIDRASDCAGERRVRAMGRSTTAGRNTGAGLGCATADRRRVPPSLVASQPCLSKGLG